MWTISFMISPMLSALAVHPDHNTVTWIKQGNRVLRYNLHETAWNSIVGEHIWSPFEVEWVTSSSFSSTTELLIYHSRWSYGVSHNHTTTLLHSLLEVFWTLDETLTNDSLALFSHVSVFYFSDIIFRKIHEGKRRTGRDNKEHLVISLLNI